MLCKLYSIYLDNIVGRVYIFMIVYACSYVGRCSIICTRLTQYQFCSVLYKLTYNTARYFPRFSMDGLVVYIVPVISNSYSQSNASIG